MEEPLGQTGLGLQGFHRLGLLPRAGGRAGLSPQKGAAEISEAKTLQVALH